MVRGPSGVLLFERPYILQVVDVEEDGNAGHEQGQLLLDRGALVLASAPDCAAHRATRLSTRGAGRSRGAGGRVGARTVRKEHVPAGAEAELQGGHALGGRQLEHRHACLLVSNDETSF